MNIGNLYAVKEYHWSLFPTKETAATATAGWPRAAAADDAWAAGYWGRRFNCEVPYFSPESFIVFLEEDGKYKKVLTSDGRIGWTWFDKNYKSCFEEMKVAV